jgi:probable non-F420 flavinoid oxidoreductase
MAVIGYHASQEQFSPSALLGLVKKAEKAGFNAAMCSDHFHPWTPEQGESGFAWSWLGAALNATSLPFGVVCAPGQRYHPAVIAQGAATLAEMFPGRFWIAVGTGQLLNERITGEKWPSKTERNERLRESMEVIRDLWAGKRVSHEGRIRVEEAQLYSLPDYPPLLIGAAITPATAEAMGSWADGLVTISQPEEKLREVVEGFRKGGGTGKPMFLKVQVSYDPDERRALEGAWEEWRSVIFPSPVQAELCSPESFAAAGGLVSRDQISRYIRVSSSIDKQIDWLKNDLALGFEQLIIHNVNRRQETFITDFGNQVLPALLK